MRGTLIYNILKVEMRPVKEVIKVVALVFRSRLSSATLHLQCIPRSYLAKQRDVPANNL